MVSTISVSLRAADDFERVVALEAEKRQLVDNLPLIVARFDVTTRRAHLRQRRGAARARPPPVRRRERAGLDGALADATEREASRVARGQAASGHALGVGGPALPAR